MEQSLLSENCEVEGQLYCVWHDYNSIEKKSPNTYLPHPCLYLIFEYVCLCIYTEIEKCIHKQYFLTIFTFGEESTRDILKKYLFSIFSICIIYEIKKTQRKSWYSFLETFIFRYIGACTNHFDFTTFLLIYLNVQ